MNKANILMVSVMNSKYINLGISQLAGYLRKQGVHTKLLFFHDGESEEYILSKIESGYQYYAFSISQMNVIQVNSIVEQIKGKNRKAKIIYGGSFASMYYKEISMDNPLVDYFVLGDGEIPTMYLLSGNSLENYPYIYSPEVESDEYKSFINSDIDWKIAEDYFMQNRKKRHIHSIISKNNICTGACTFCCIQKSQCIKYKSVDEILEEVKKFSDLYGVTHFYFIDNDLLDPGDQVGKKRIYEFCEKVISLKRELHFYCSTKVTAFTDNQEDNALLEVMYLAGFDSIFLGVEAANNDDLKLYNKKNRVKDNAIALKLLKRHKIHPDIGFICFNPYSTLSSIKDNFQFLIDYEIEDITHYTQSFLEIYKGSSFYKLATNRKLFGPKYDYMHLDEYKFVSQDAATIRDIVCFLKTNFKNNQALSVEDGWARFAVFYNGLLQYNSNLLIFIDDYNKLKQEYFEILSWYFGKLYIENDIEFCQLHYEEFFDKYLENKKTMNILRRKIIMQNVRDKNKL